MSAEDELKETIGDPSSGRAPRPVAPGIVLGSTDPADMIRALEADVRKIYDGLHLLAREIDDLRSQIIGG
jgi:hypothetical protein